MQYSLENGLKSIFGSDVVRRDTTAQRILEDLPYCDTTERLLDVLKRLMDRVSEIERSTPAGASARSSSLPQRKRMTIRL